jgi:ABC-type spermidine/putrescine transport system permease subunit II
MSDAWMHVVFGLALVGIVAGTVVAVLVSFAELAA